MSLADKPFSCAGLDARFFRFGEAGVYQALGYWVLSVENPELPRLKINNNVDIWMAAQYDAEDQASVGDDDVWGDVAFTPALAKVVAPVQLVERWSPFPDACRCLGVPMWVDKDRHLHWSLAVACWRADFTSCPADVNQPNKAHAMFRSRLINILGATGPLGSYIVLVARNGWSFDQEHRKLSPICVNALKASGHFQFFDRAPF